VEQDPPGDAGWGRPNTVARLFRPADPTRPRRLEFWPAGERTIAESGAYAGNSQPRASVHLSCPVDCGRQPARRDGRKLRHTAGDRRVADLTAPARALAIALDRRPGAKDSFG
jgi:ArsR family transcriptional regulator, cadmium/lead-responsive transcriptional repressor